MGPIIIGIGMTIIGTMPGNAPGDPHPGPAAVPQAPNEAGFSPPISSVWTEAFFVLPGLNIQTP